MKNLTRITLSAIASCAVLVIAAPASAAPNSAASVSAPGAKTSAEQAAVTNYWTPARMRNATDADATPSAKSAPTSSKSASTKKAQPRTVSAQRAAKGLPGSPAVSTVGKVFFTLGGLDYTCSGNVVSSANKDVVVTAGHCVNEGPGDFATSWAFAPAYANGSAPYGLWTARALISTTGWVTKGDMNVDGGFAIMNKLGGKHISDVTGSTAIGFNLPTGLRYTAWGYPADSPYDGQTLKHCTGNANKNKVEATMSSQGITCTMTGGSSGGPWMTANGVQNSVNSYGYGNVSSRMYGPYFGTAIESAYNTAAHS